jgi:hypothetical protein
MRAGLAVRASTVPARVHASRLPNREIADVVDMYYNQMGIWRQRYSEFGLVGLEDLEGSGNPMPYRRVVAISPLPEPAAYRSE